MAGLILGAIGASIGGPTGWMIGSFIGNALFPPSLPDQNIEGPRLNDLRVQVSTYGQMIPIVWGTNRLAGNVIWARPIEERVTTTSQEAGGKGGGGQTVNQTTYSYYADFAVGLCEGPIIGVRRIWANGELIFNAGAGAASADIAASTLNAQAIRVYTGSEVQGQDPLIVAYEGAANTPAYRGHAYVVVDDMHLGPFGNRFPNLEFEVVTSGSIADLGIPTVATLGASDGSTARVLGANGNVYAGPMTTGGNANRWNLYSGTKASTYPPPSYTYIPAGVTPAGDAIATGSFAGVLAVLHEDGGVTRYTGGAANMGSGGALGILAEPDNDIWWCRGDSSASTTLFRVVVDHENLTLTDTALSGFYTLALARNGVAIAGRCYVLATIVSGGQAYIGYVSAQSLAFVPLVAITGFAGFLVASTGTLWFGPNNNTGDRDEIHQYSADGTLLQTVILPTVASAGWEIFEDPTGLIWAVGLTGFGANKRAYCIQPSTGSLLFTSQDFVGTPLGFTSDNRFVVWDTVTGNFVLKEIERLPRLTSTTVQLSTVVSAIAQRAGVAAGDLDVAALTDSVDGYKLSRPSAARSAIEPLATAYAFDLVESDLKIKAVKRGGSIAAVIAEDDLAAHVDEETPPPLDGVRALETELPRTVRVIYADVDAAYEQGTQEAPRRTGRSQQIATIEVAIAMTAAKAKQLATRLLYSRHAQRVSQRWATTRKYAHLEPTDLVQLVRGNLVFTVFIERKDESRGLIQWQGVTEDVAAYTQAGSGAAAPAVSQSVSAVVPTSLRLLDIPILRDTDDEAGFYAAACGVTDAWAGAELWKSIDGGASYGRSDTAFLVASVIGSAITAMPTFLGGNVIDEYSRVDVQVSGGALSSVTADQMFAGANAMYLGGEIIAFRDATLLSTGKYRLSGLLRGRRGTEQYMGTHAIGDVCVLLSAGTMKRVLAATSEIGAARRYKAPAFGQALAQAAEQEFTNTAVGLKPLSPVQLVGGRNAAGDVIGKWTRRTRVGGEWRDYVDAQLGEASELYEVEVWNSTYTTLKRTVTGLTSSTFTYTSAQQTTDFGSNQATVYVRVFQISAVVGRGFALQGSI